ncbi:MAG: hypothetical protein ACOYCA_04805 [Eggerthellaceae bacterium]|jgi:hypothetical protein
MEELSKSQKGMVAVLLADTFLPTWRSTITLLSALGIEEQERAAYFANAAGPTLPRETGISAPARRTLF